MAADSSRNLVGKIGVVSAGIIGVLSFITAVLTNFGSITQGFDNLFGASEANVKLVQSQLFFKSLGILIPYDVNGIDFYRIKPEGADDETLVNLDLLRRGDIDAHHAFRELDELEQLVISRRLAEGNDKFAIVTPNQLKDVLLVSLRVLVEKKTASKINNCKATVYFPNGLTKDTYNSVSLPEGIWKNYVEFGLMVNREIATKAEATAGWEVVLSCDSDGRAVGDGPVPLAVSRS